MQWGMLLPAHLPQGLPPFPVWLHDTEGDGSDPGLALVSLEHAGGVELSADQRRVLLTYQGVLQRHLVKPVKVCV